MRGSPWSGTTSSSSSTRGPATSTPASRTLYENLADLGGGQFLIRPEGQFAGSYGAIALAEVDPEARTVSVTPAVPLGASRPDDIIVSPDHTQALLEVGDAWYLAAIGELDAEPTPVDVLSPAWADGDVVGWA